MAGVENSEQRQPKTVSEFLRREVFNARKDLNKATFGEKRGPKVERIRIAESHLLMTRTLFTALGVSDLSLTPEDQVEGLRKQIIVTGEDLRKERIRSTQLTGENKKLHNGITETLGTAITSFLGNVTSEQAGEVLGGNFVLEHLAEIPAELQLQLLLKIIHVLCEGSEQEFSVWRENDLRWMQMIAPLPKEKQLRKGIHYLSAAWSPQEFASESGINGRHTLPGYIKGDITPDAKMLHAMIKTSPLESEDMISQLLFLRAAGMDPYSLRDLQENSIERDILHIRTLKGQTQKEAAEELSVHYLTISAWEQGRTQLTKLDEDALRSWLGPQNKALADVMLAKARKYPVEITQKILQEILAGSYLFAEHLEALEPFPLEDHDARLLDEATSLADQFRTEDSDNVFGKVFRHIRKEKKKTQKAIGNDVIHIENGRTIPKSKKIVAYAAEGFDYSLPHPIVCFLLDVASEEQRR